MASLPERDQWNFGVKILPFLMLLAATHQAATNTTALSTPDQAANKTDSHPVADNTNSVTNNATSGAVATNKTDAVLSNKPASPPATTNKTTDPVVKNVTSSGPVATKPEGPAPNNTSVPAPAKPVGPASNASVPATKPVGPASNTSIPAPSKPEGPASNNTSAPVAKKNATETVVPNKPVPTGTATDITKPAANKTTAATTEKSDNKTVSSSAKIPGPTANKTAPATGNKTTDGQGIGVGNHLIGIDPDTLSCDPLGQIFLLLPHFTDCSKFFMCAHGAEVEFSCAPGGLYFDFEQQTCDFSWRSRCWLRTLPDSEIEGSGESFDFLSDEADRAVRSLTGDNVANIVRPISEDTQKISSSAINCLRADSASKLVPYKGDCQRYWRCVNGVAQSVYCNDGLFFNERTQQCDFEANVRCLVEQEDELKSEFILYKTK